MDVTESRSLHSSLRTTYASDLPEIVANNHDCEAARAAARKKLSDLRPSLPEGAWESLLLAIRDHLERQLPLDMQLRAQLPDGRFECWQVQGLAERNAAGQPVYLAGSMREVAP